MIFGKALIGKVLSGEKTVTRRRLRDIPSRYREGGYYKVQPGRGKQHVGHIVVISVDDEPVFTGTRWREAQREGFSTPREFVDYWTWLHGSWNPTELVAVIRFELQPRCPDCAELEA